jgi:hypothetical protein
MNAPVPTPTQSEAVPVKERRISKRIAEVVRLVVTGECATQKAAAERVGMNASHVCEMLKKPHVRVFIDRRVRETIANGTMRATARLLALMDSDSEHVSLDAVKHELALNGIKPANDAQVSIDLNVRAGFIIDLAEPAQPMRDVTPSTSPRR